MNMDFVGVGLYHLSFFVAAVVLSIYQMHKGEL